VLGDEQARNREKEAQTTQRLRNLQNSVNLNKTVLLVNLIKG
jgi:hypothetical protein